MSKFDSMSPARKITFFSARDLDDPIRGDERDNIGHINVRCDDPADRSTFLEVCGLTAPFVKSVSFDFALCGLHITVIEWGAGLRAPLHSHSDDCVYYVERGSLVMGNRKIQSGEGFLVPKDQAYGFVVGPEGAKVIEFTGAPRHDINLLDRNMPRWKDSMEKAAAKLKTH